MALLFSYYSLYFIPNSHFSCSTFTCSIIKLTEQAVKPIHPVACPMNFICSPILKAVLNKHKRDHLFLIRLLNGENLGFQMKRFHLSNLREHLTSKESSQGRCPPTEIHHYYIFLFTSTRCLAESFHLLLPASCQITLVPVQLALLPPTAFFLV